MMEIRPYEHWFSKLKDAYYLDKLDRRESRKSREHRGKAIATGATIGLPAGAIVGSLGKGAAPVLIGSAAGAAAGGYLGHKLSKPGQKRIKEKYDKERERYRIATEAEKKFLRQRLRDIEDDEDLDRACRRL